MADRDEPGRYPQGPRSSGSEQRGDPPYGGHPDEAGQYWAGQYGQGHEAAPTEMFPTQPGGYGGAAPPPDTAYGEAPYAQQAYGYDPYSQGPYGDTAYQDAAYQDTAYGGGAYGQYAPGAYPPGQHGDHGGYYADPRSPAYAGAGGSRRSPALAVLVVAAVVAVLALLCGGGYWLFTRLDDSGGTGTVAEQGAPGDAGSGSGGAAVTALSPCPTPPDFTDASVSSGAGGLVVTAEATASCPDGDVITDDAFTVTATAGGHDVAAGTFDLSRSPIALRSGAPESVSFVFPAGTYWIPADAVSGPVTVRAQHGGASSPPPEGTTTAAAGPVTASGPAAPAGGSRDAAALHALRAIAEQSRPAIESRIAGRWAAQLSSKRNGLVAEGRTWGYSDILNEYLSLRRQYPDMVLAWSDDWSTFELPGWWVMLRGHSEPTPEAVLQWCRDQDYDRDHCLAKIVADDRGPDGTTRMQPD